MCINIFIFTKINCNLTCDTRHTISKRRCLCSIIIISRRTWFWYISSRGTIMADRAYISCHAICRVGDECAQSTKISGAAVGGHCAQASGFAVGACGNKMVICELFCCLVILFLIHFITYSNTKECLQNTINFNLL